MSQDHRGVVLIAEDEPMVRLVAAVNIHEMGFETIEACDANEAARLIERHPEIAILFADIEMPGSIDGMSLAAYVHGRWPHIRIILTSGCVPGEAVKLPPDSAFLAKPYSAGALEQLLKPSHDL